MSEKKKRLLLSLFPRATSQAAALVRIFGDCREGGITRSLLRVISLFGIALFLLSSVPVRAEGLVQIDANKKYKGMNASFAKGYTPSVKKDIMRLVIPFRTDAAVQGGQLLIGVSFEREENSPFYFKNYQKQVKPSANGVYLYKCKIRLRKDRINGQYPLHLSVLVKTAEGNMREEFTIYAEITDGREALPLGEETQGEDGSFNPGLEETTFSGEKEKIIRQPRIILEKMICRERSFWRAAAYFGH